MTIIVLVSVNGHMVVAGISKYLLAQPVLFSLLQQESQLAGHDSLPGSVIHTFIPEVCGPMSVLFGLDSCSFPLILLT